MIPNFQNVQTDTVVRVSAVICLMLAFIASLVIMVFQFIQHGDLNLPPLINTIITGVLFFASNALSTHQGAQLQQNGNVTGAATVADTTMKAATALEKINSGPIITQAAAVEANTAATEKNTQATIDASHG